MITTNLLNLHPSSKFVTVLNDMLLNDLNDGLMWSSHAVTLNMALSPLILDHLRTIKSDINHDDMMNEYTLEKAMNYANSSHMGALKLKQYLVMMSESHDLLIDREFTHFFELIANQIIKQLKRSQTNAMVLSRNFLSVDQLNILPHKEICDRIDVHLANEHHDGDPWKSRATEFQRAIVPIIIDDFRKRSTPINHYDFLEALDLNKALKFIRSDHTNNEKLKQYLITIPDGRSETITQKFVEHYGFIHMQISRYILMAADLHNVSKPHQAPSTFEYVGMPLKI